MGYHGLVYVHQKLSPIFPSKGVFHNHLKTNIMPLTEKKYLIYGEAFPMSFQFAGCVLI